MSKILVASAGAILALGASGAGNAKIGGEWGGPTRVTPEAARNIRVATQAAREDLLAGRPCVQLHLDGAEVIYERCDAGHVR